MDTSFTFLYTKKGHRDLPTCTYRSTIGVRIMACNKASQ